MSVLRDGHGLDEYKRLLDSLPSEVHVVLGGTDAKSKAAFDRMVRESMDRQHRKRMIAER